MKSKLIIIWLDFILYLMRRLEKFNLFIKNDEVSIKYKEINFDFVVYLISYLYFYFYYKIIIIEYFN